MKLSITWRARLLNSLLSAGLMVALVLLAQNRIAGVLYGAIDHTLQEQARAFAHPPQRGPEHEHGPQPPFPNDNRWPRFDNRGPRFDDRRRREPPPLRFGMTSLLFPRRLPLDAPPQQARTPEGQTAWSIEGFTAAQKNGSDLRATIGGDGSLLHVFSLRVPATRDNPAQVIQTAATLDETEAALQEIQMALYTLLVPLMVISAVLGAALTDVALAPVRRLVRAVTQLDPNNLSHRLPAPGGQDSFDQLVTLLNALLGRIEAAFSRQKRFTADASHELRTPLAVLKTATSLLLESPESLNPVQQRTLTRADQTVDRANRLISDLLLLARTEGGILPVRRVPIVLTQALAEAIAAAEAGQPPPHAPILLTCPEALTTTTDPDHLHRLIVNLLSNALRHTPATGTITVTAAEADGQLVLTIHDTGEGIPADELARLGEPFYRPDASRARTHGGAGLGLALCKGILTTLGGTFTLDSTLGKGTTATVRLPRA